MSTVVRRPRAQDLPDFLAAFGTAMGLPLPPDHAPRLLRLLDLEGSFVAEDRGRLVGTLGAYASRRRPAVAASPRPA